jgi:hypothetical protein
MFTKLSRVVCLILMSTAAPAAQERDCAVPYRNRFEDKSYCSDPNATPKPPAPRSNRNAGSLESRFPGRLPDLNPPGTLVDPDQLRELMLGTWRFIRTDFNSDKSAVEIPGKFTFFEDGRYRFSAGEGGRILMTQEGRYRIFRNEAVPTLALTPLATNGQADFVDYMQRLGLIGRVARNLYLSVSEPRDSSRPNRATLRASSDRASSGTSLVRE